MLTCSCEPLRENLCLKTLLGKLFVETLAWKPLPENIAWEPACWEPCLDTSSWKPLPGNTCLKTCSGNLVSFGKNMFLEILLGKCCLETLKPGNLAWEPLPGNLAWEPVPGNLAWEPLAGNPCLGTCSWEPLGNLTWEHAPGNLAWKPCLGTSSWEPGSQSCAVRIWLLRGILLEKESLPQNPVPNLAPCGFGCSDLLRNLYYG